MSLQLTEVWRYPVKSCRGEQLTEAAVEPWGLAGDRRWMIVDGAGDPVTARECPPLVLVSPRVEDGKITLASPGLPEVTVPVPSGGDLVPVNVWGSDLLATLADDAAATWLTGIIGEPARLVYLDDPTRRATNPKYSLDTDRVSFADGYPLLLTSMSSLDELGDWLAADGDQPVPMNRFRPNAVVTGFGPWAEDRWRRVRIGAVTFRVAKPCGRCVVTTTDQFTGVRGSQPLRMLARKRRFGQSLVFGQNVIPDTPGQIRIGDPVEILEYAS